jgi:putative transposase
MMGMPIGGLHILRGQGADPTVVVADRWFASPKTCSQCGHVVETLPLSMRESVCSACGACHDRDINAARNLAKLGVSSTVSACGEEGSGSGLVTGTKPVFVKQESSIKDTYL